ALRRLVEDDQVEDRLAREELRDGLGRRHPHGTELEERVAALDAGAVSDDLAEAHRLLPAAGQTAAQVGADRVEARAGLDEQAVLLPLRPLAGDDLADELLLAGGQLEIAVEGVLETMAVDGLEVRLAAQPAGDLAA